MGYPGAPVGVIYGDVKSTEFDLAVSDPTLKRLDYVETDHNGSRVLALVETVTRESGLSYEDALSGQGREDSGKLSAHVRVIGYKDGAGRVQVPRTPFPAGGTVRLADEGIVTSILGLEGGKKGAFIGKVKGLDVPVHLNLNTLAQKHLSVLAKTGAGKSYTVGVILEEFLAHKVPLVILDPHGEYGSLRYPNMEDKELDAMVRYGVKPKSFQNQIQEYAVDVNLNPDAERLRLDGVNLTAREITEILPAKLSGGQVGVLHQAVKDVSDHNPSYTIQDIIDIVNINKSNAKWNVLNALDSLQGTGLFAIKGTPLKDLVKPGKCTIINLKGVAPDIQEVVAGRITNMLWEARKRNEIPAHILVVEEAHNFCPERGVGSAVSGPVLRTVASEGRKFGMGLVIVSQRPAKIDKNVLSQCNTQVVLKITNPNDLKAIVSSVEGITSETANEIQRLSVGVCMVAGGGLAQPVLVDVRPRVTRHGGASIDVLAGQKQQLSKARKQQDEEPIRLAKVRPEEIYNVEAPEAEILPEPKKATKHRDPVADIVASKKPAGKSAGKPVSAAKLTPKTQQTPPPKPAPVAKKTVTTEVIVNAHRVARRAGLVGSDDPNKTKTLLQDVALRQNKQQDYYLHHYAEIGISACHAESPTCIRCPLRDSCTFHKQLQAERQKARTGIKRLWTR